MNKFTSLDDLGSQAESGDKPLSPEELRAGSPLDPGAFIDTSNWADEFDSAAELAQPAQTKPGRSRPPIPGDAQPPRPSRARDAPHAAQGRPLQAGRAHRRPLPADRLRAVGLRDLRDPEDQGAHAVQERLLEHAPGARLAAPPDARLLRRGGARADAHRAELVP